MEDAKFTLLKHIGTGDIGVIVDSNISETTYCKTHDNEGEVLGCTQAECYCFENHKSNFAKDCMAGINKYCGEINGDDLDLSKATDVDSMISLFSEHENREKITRFINDWERTHSKHIKCRCVTYWNGFYWRSIMLHHETKDLKDFGFEIVEGKEATRIVNEIPDFPSLDGPVSIKTANFNFLFSKDPSPYYCEILAWNY